MSFAVIEDYNLAVDLSTHNLPGKAKDEIPYEAICDGPLYDDPNEPDLWEKQKKSLLHCINNCRKEGIVPIVAVFVPR
jgi:hypothetical protein